MILDIKKAEKEFLKYVKNFDETEYMINLKKHHSIRVMNISNQIAKTIFKDEKQIELASLIGLLHDIARFEQYTKYKTFNDLESFDHGDYGVEILKKDNYIRKFIQTDKYDNIILKAIENHNKFQIEKGLTEEELAYSKLIRDADKLDIFFEACTLFYKDQKYKIENSKISKYIEKDFKEKKIIKREKGKRIDGIDNVLSTIAFVFDLNYKESFKILKKEDYINKIFNQFDFKFDETKEKVKELKKLTSDYIEEKIHNE